MLPFLSNSLARQPARLIRSAASSAHTRAMVSWVDVFSKTFSNNPRRRERVEDRQRGEPLDHGGGRGEEAPPLALDLHEPAQSARLDGAAQGVSVPAGLGGEAGDGEEGVGREGSEGGGHG